ncbi:MAG: hypothetical protein ACM3QZ_06990 [Solirubrobacterales bacterium]
MEQKITENMENATKFMDELSEKMWEAYMKGLEEGLKFTKTWTDMMISSLDQSKEAQNKAAVMAEEAMKNLKDMQSQFRVNYTDAMRQVWEKYAIKKF